MLGSGTDASGSATSGTGTFGAVGFGTVVFGTVVFGTVVFGTDCFGLDALGLDVFGLDVFGAWLPPVLSFGVDGLGVASGLSEARQGFEPLRGLPVPHGVLVGKWLPLGLGLG
ncbi:hypothetical protein [Actinomadura geliboluensis]|uniref:hypothetical protein n=1 Tax=Actinomadura geliboluensis TaxID=882440 RepID=UPI0036CF9712